MKKLLLTAIALSSLVTAPAVAADLPPASPVYQPPPPVVVTPWTGCYIGGEGGGIWANKKWTDNDPSSLTFGESFGSHDASGWLAGIQAGCDYQFYGGFVVGIQADYDWAGANGSNDNLLFPGFLDETHVKSVGSATARLGYGWEAFLFYVKGGGAWEHDEYDVNLPGIGVINAGVNPLFGWTAGVGGEYLFTPWLSGFIEYDYYGFSSRNLIFSDGTLIKIRETDNVVKAGLNFRFTSWWGRY